MIYRIEEKTKRNGTITYYPQYKNLCFWWHFYYFTDERVSFFNLKDAQSYIEAVKADHVCKVVHISA